jgi:hypothetical protein
MLFFSSKGFDYDCLTKERVQWESEVVPYDGVPFVCVGRRTLVCQHGHQRWKTEKRKVSNVGSEQFLVVISQWNSQLQSLNASLKSFQLKQMLAQNLIWCS